MSAKCFLCAIVGHFDLQVSVHSSCKCPSVSSTWEWWMTGTFKAVHCQPLQDVSSLQTPGDHCALPRNGLKVAQTNVSFLRPLHTGERFIHVINLQVYIFRVVVFVICTLHSKKETFFSWGRSICLCTANKKASTSHITSHNNGRLDDCVCHRRVLYDKERDIMKTIWQRWLWMSNPDRCYIYMQIYRRGAKAVISICAVFKSTRLLW